MKLLRPFLAGLALLAAAGPAGAQLTTEDVRQLQTRFQQAEEDVERLRARVQKLEATVAELRSQVGDVKNVAASAGKDAVTQDQLKKVVEQLRDLDRRRQEDNDKIVQQLKKLAELPAGAPPVAEDGKARPVRKAVADASSTNTPSTGAGESKPPANGAQAESKDLLPADYEFYEHVIAENQTLGQIIAEYNKAYGLKIRLKHVLEANPKIRPERLIVGRKIRVPVVK